MTPEQIAEIEGLVAKLRALQTTREKFVMRRGEMNAAIPALDASPARRAVYDECYKADHEAERELFRSALKFAEEAASADFATALETLILAAKERDRLKAENERLREALKQIERAPAWGAPDRWETTPSEVRQLARTALEGTVG